MGGFDVNGIMVDGEAQGPIPARFRRIMERVAARDREWFARHPAETHYVRPYVPGELWPRKPPEGVDVVVLVTRVAPGFRLREVIAHAVKGPSGRMHIVDETGEVWLRDVPMEGVGP